MHEIIQESIKGYNLPFTILLGVIIVYWIVALLGVVDIDGGDFDIDMDTDVDGGGVDGTSGNFLDAAIRFVGLSDAPLMMVLSLYVIMLWVCNMIANMSFNPAQSNGQASLLLIPVVIIGFIITRLLIRPLRPVMKMMRATEPPAKIIGEQGVVISATITSEFGRVQVDFDGKPLLLRAVVSENSESLAKGANVLVVSKKDSDDIYIVRPL